MKTTIKSAIIFSAFALLSTGAFAANKMKTDTLENDVTASVSYYENTCGVDINIANATEGNALITIYDAIGGVMLSDKFAVDADNVKKSYLLGALADGDYTIEVASSTGVVRHTVQLNKDAATETTFAF